MPQRIFQSLTATALLLIMYSCNTNSDPVKVLVDKRADKPTKITIDGTIVHTIKSDSALPVMLKPGKHTVAVNDSTAREFTVGNKGGILNLDDIDYVAYEIRYVAEDRSNRLGFDMNSFVLKSTILLDSFIIVPKGPLSKADSLLRKIVPKLQASKDGNYYSGGYDEENEGFHGLKKTGKGKLFINKFWDYSMDEDIPQTIQIRTNSSFGATSTTRSSIMHANIFLLYAMMNEEEFTVKSLRSVMEGREDQQKEKELKEKQLEF
jgi:hypothetical protein